MVAALFEWDIYFTYMKRDQRKIPFIPMVEAAIKKTVYFNVLTVFFALYHKFAWTDFIRLRRHSDSLFYLLRMAQGLKNGVKTHGGFGESGKDISQDPYPKNHPLKKEDEADGVIPARKKCPRFALYVSSRGEKVLQSMIRNAADSGEFIKALDKAETFTAQKTVLRIWYDSYWDSPLVPVLQEFWAKAPKDDYKSIASHAEGYTTEIGHFHGPLRLMAFSDFDYDLSQADGTAWLCRSCSELDNDFSDHGFIRDWEAIEVIGKNGHTLSTQFIKHVNGEIRCKACGCYNVIDERTGKEANNLS